MIIKAYPYDQYNRRPRHPPRTITYHQGERWPPYCAWCRVRPLVLLADVVQEGSTVDLVATLARCDWCNYGTIIRREVEHGKLAYRY